jgi:hypothetical protein
MIKLLDILKEIKVRPSNIGESVTFKDWITYNIYDIFEVLGIPYADDWFLTSFKDLYHKPVPDDTLYMMFGGGRPGVWLSKDIEILKKNFPILTKTAIINGKEIAYLA